VDTIQGITLHRWVRDEGLRINDLFIDEVIRDYPELDFSLSRGSQFLYNQVKARWYIFTMKN